MIDKGNFENAIKNPDSVSLKTMLSEGANVNKDVIKDAYLSFLVKSSSPITRKDEVLESFKCLKLLCDHFKAANPTKEEDVKNEKNKDKKKQKLPLLDDVIEKLGEFGEVGEEVSASDGFQNFAKALKVKDPAAMTPEKYIRTLDSKDTKDLFDQYNVQIKDNIKRNEAALADAYTRIVLEGAGMTKEKVDEIVNSKDKKWVKYRDSIRKTLSQNPALQIDDKKLQADGSILEWIGREKRAAFEVAAKTEIDNLRGQAQLLLQKGIGMMPDFASLASEHKKTVLGYTEGVTNNPKWDDLLLKSAEYRSGKHRLRSAFTKRVLGEENDVKENQSLSRKVANFTLCLVFFGPNITLLIYLLRLSRTGYLYKMLRGGIKGLKNDKEKGKENAQGPKGQEQGKELNSQGLDQKELNAKVIEPISGGEVASLDVVPLPNTIRFANGPRPFPVVYPMRFNPRINIAMPGQDPRSIGINVNPGMFPGRYPVGVNPGIPGQGPGRVPSINPGGNTGVMHQGGSLEVKNLPPQMTNFINQLPPNVVQNIVTNIFNISQSNGEAKYVLGSSGVHIFKEGDNVIVNVLDGGNKGGVKIVLTDKEIGVLKDLLNKDRVVQGEDVNNLRPSIGEGRVIEDGNIIPQVDKRNAIEDAGVVVPSWNKSDVIGRRDVLDDQKVDSINSGLVVPRSFPSMENIIKPLPDLVRPSIQNPELPGLNPQISGVSVDPAGNARIVQRGDFETKGIPFKVLHLLGKLRQSLFQGVVASIVKVESGENLDAKYQIGSSFIGIRKTSDGVELNIFDGNTNIGKIEFTRRQVRDLKDLQEQSLGGQENIPNKIDQSAVKNVAAPIEDVKSPGEEIGNAMKSVEEKGNQGRENSDKGFGDRVRFKKTNFLPQGAKGETAEELYRRTRAGLRKVDQNPGFQKGDGSLDYHAALNKNKVTSANLEVIAEVPEENIDAINSDSNLRDLASNIAKDALGHIYAGAIKNANTAAAEADAAVNRTVAHGLNEVYDSAMKQAVQALQEIKGVEQIKHSLLSANEGAEIGSVNEVIGNDKRSIGISGASEAISVSEVSPKVVSVNNVVGIDDKQYLKVSQQEPVHLINEENAKGMPTYPVKHTKKSFAREEFIAFEVKEGLPHTSSNKNAKILKGQAKKEKTGIAFGKADKGNKAMESGMRNELKRLFEIRRAREEGGDKMAADKISQGDITTSIKDDLTKIRKEMAVAKENKGFTVHPSNIQSTGKLKRGR